MTCRIQSVRASRRHCFRSCCPARSRRSRIVALRTIGNLIFPSTEIETPNRQYYTYESTNGRLFEDPFPRYPTKTELESWRRENKIRPRDVRFVEGPTIVKTTHFNACSPAQVIHGLRSLGWDPESENESGSIRTGEIELFGSRLPEGRLIAAYRGYAKLRSFTEQWLSHSRDGKLYHQFLGNQAATGRSSCKSPNIQQIPTSKTRKSGLRALVPYGKRCRSLFRPQDGYTLVVGDLKGIEIRLLAHRLYPGTTEETSLVVSRAARTSTRLTRISWGYHERPQRRCSTGACTGSVRERSRPTCGSIARRLK